MADSIFDILEESIGEKDSPALEEFDMPPGLETELFLTAMEGLLTPDEFQDIVLEGAQDLELYGLIDSADAVLDAYDVAQEGSYNKKIVVKQTKDVVMDRIEKRTCLRIEQRADSALWKQYKAGRTKMIDAREKIYAKNGSKARQIAKKAMQNSGRKAAAMQSKKGATITEKMDATINRMQRK